jgi:hypothetical protein
MNINELVKFGVFVSTSKNIEALADYLNCLSTVLEEDCFEETINS